MCCFSIYESASQHRRYGFDPWVWKTPWRREWQPIPVFLPGKIPWTRGNWQATVHGVARVGHSWATKQVCSTTQQTKELPVHMTAGMNLRNIALISGRTRHQAVPSVLFFFFFFLIFGCAGSLLPYGLLSRFDQWGPLSSCSERTYCDGLSCEAQTAACKGFSSCRTWAQ